MPRSVARHSAPITSAARTCSAPWDGASATCQPYTPSAAGRGGSRVASCGFSACDASPTESDRPVPSLPLPPASRRLSDRPDMLGMDEKQLRDPGTELTAAMRDGCKSSFRWTLWPLLARVPVGAGDD